MDDAEETTLAAIERRFGAPIVRIDPAARPREWPSTWRDLATRGSCRAFTQRPVAPELIETLCALALASPSKSDLQQRDIVIIDDRQIRAAIDGLLTGAATGQAWIAAAPALLVFCANNRRQRQLHTWRGKPFANDHLVAFFNAALDAGIALAACVIAAEAAGLGCAPISAIRNHAEAVSELIGLPDHVFPIAGLALGWPAHSPRISMRLPLARPSTATVSRKARSSRPSTPMTCAATRPSPSAPSAASKASVRPIFTAGRKTRCASMLPRSAPIGAHSCVLRAFAWIDGSALGSPRRRPAPDSDALGSLWRKCAHAG